MDAPSDTGGIAGYSSGSIVNCIYTGSVGYPHIGYNLGGIAGRTSGFISQCRNEGSITGRKDAGGIAGQIEPHIQTVMSQDYIETLSKGRTSGFISQCRNEGSITGRKDAGGIAGQIEPHIQTVMSQDYIETLSKQFDSLGGLVSQAGSNGAGFGGQVQSCVQAIGSYQSSAREALEELAAGAGDGEINRDALSQLGSAVHGMAGASGELRNAIGQGVDTLGGDIHSISNQIGAIARTFALATEEAQKETITDISDVDLDDISEGRVVGCINHSISNQIGAIARTFALATEEAQKETITDISDVDLDDISEGRVVGCINTGTVEADLNVGGITGIMGLESTADPEDDVGGSKLTQRKRYELKAIVEDCENLADLNVGGITGIMGLESTADPEDDVGGSKLTQRKRYELKAIVEDCENLAAITGKRSYVGSICGRMELGLIINSRGYGKAISEDGDYVGGIAGLAGGTIRQCLAKCSLSGGSYVGGIVGSGITEDYGGNSSAACPAAAMWAALWAAASPRITAATAVWSPGATPWWKSPRQTSITVPLPEPIREYLQKITSSAIPWPASTR